MKRTIVIFSGAGLSAESGIPTFRDADGVWEQHRIEDVATPEAWRRNKQLVLEFYAMRFHKAQEVQPNPAHHAIAMLQKNFTVINITQNIDTLLERAGCTSVWHLHGRIDFQKCEHHYSLQFLDEFFPACDFSSQIFKPIKLGDTCPKCALQLRPDVVWFGEPVDMRENELFSLQKEADIFIGIGTSAQVYPAAGLLSVFRYTKEKYFIDPKPAYEVLNGFSVLQGTASEQMPKLAESLLR
ncbi:MAG: silent information regulator protein Sir2 [Bacteroidetes bacterium]|nr:silent information regulator protein Sir2 [Bacteroidota bacterium]